MTLRSRLVLLSPLLAVLLAVVAPAWLASDNLHAVVESTSYDRLMLGLRTLEPAPGTPRWDAHFPLGTAALMAVPWSTGLDPVGFGRVVSLLSALVAALALFALLRRAAGPAAAAAGAACIWLVPAFTRGAVVTGEEAICTALMLLAALALVRGHAAEHKAGWMVASLLAINGMVLFRLDAMTLVPLFALLGFAAWGRRWGAAHGLACFASTIGHVWISAATIGDPIGFARVASMNIRRNADGFDALGPDVLPVNLAAELGGWPVLVGALLGLAVLLRGRDGERPAARTLGVLLGGTLVIDLALTMSGAMEARTMRYLVPLLALGVAGNAALVGMLLGRSRWVGAAIGVGIAALLVGQVPEIRRQAAEERLPVGLVETAGWLGEHAGAGRVLVGEQHPTFVVESGLPWTQLDVLPPGAPGGSAAEVIRAKLDGVRWLVQVDGNPPTSALRKLAEVDREPAFAAGCCRVFAVSDRDAGLEDYLAAHTSPDWERYAAMDAFREQPAASRAVPRLLDLAEAQLRERGPDWETVANDICLSLSHLLEADPGVSVPPIRMVELMEAGAIWTTIQKCGWVLALGVARSGHEGLEPRIVRVLVPGLASQRSRVRDAVSRTLAQLAPGLDELSQEDAMARALELWPVAALDPKAPPPWLRERVVVFRPVLGDDGGPTTWDWGAQGGSLAAGVEALIAAVARSGDRYVVAPVLHVPAETIGEPWVDAAQEVLEPAAPEEAGLTTCWGSDVFLPVWPPLRAAWGLEPEVR